MVSVEDQMAAAWAKPLLAAMGAKTDRRPYENYYAQIARISVDHAHLAPGGGVPF